ncbi:hypothetical protein MNBD_GAMMA23-481 [hydrothermal vent metagenome]|uniref:SPOR domain-containing protein n=1 Tax=hydrothermal vent metagenome TaxID=652676 RepID=A0A3B1AAA3_9ZZZZ
MANYDADQLKRLEPAYLRQYGLNEAPFSTQHDDNFLYLDAERHQRLDMLSHLTQYSNLLLIVTGERGIGKTSLLRRFCNNADDLWYLCEVHAHTMMDADSMLTDIARGFGLNGMPSDPSAVQEIVFEHLKALQNDDLVPILLIDDAHELPKDALETLFYFADIEAAQGHLLRIILFCEPQIDIMLESPSIRPLRERITHTLELNPLDEDQTAEFIKHRMAVAGFEGASPFTPKVIQKIHKIARGIPSHICELAHLHLDDAASLGHKINHVDLTENAEPDLNDQFNAEDLGINPDNGKPINYNAAAFSTRHIVFIAIVAIVSIIVFTMQDSINEAVTPKDDSLSTVNRNLPSAIAEQGNIPKATAAKEITLKAPPQPTAPQLEDEPEQTPTTSPQNSNAGTATPAQQATLANNVTPQAEPIEYVLDTVSPSPVIGSNKPQTITIKGSGFKSSANPPTVWISWTGKTKVLKKHQYKIIDDNNIELTITVGTTADEWSAQLKQNSTESNRLSFSVIKPKAKPAHITTLAGIHDERWILDQEPNHFTLQLLGTQNKNSIKKFTKANKLTDKVAVYQTLRNNKAWYALIYGSYATKEAAQLAKNKIVNSKVKPWLRRFDSVQAKINTEKTAHKPLKPKKKLQTAKSPTTIITSPPLTEAKDSSAWLWSQDPRHYTLQLLGGQNDKNIQQFIRKYKLKGKAVYFYTRHNQRNWYALVYGSYKNRTDALQAIKKLPPALQKTSPWARSFASIHKDLDQSQ